MVECLQHQREDLIPNSSAFVNSPGLLAVRSCAHTDTPAPGGWMVRRQDCGCLLAASLAPE